MKTTKTDKRFELVQRREVPELGSSAAFYRHIKTGAELLSLENDDSNKVFGIAFKTPPQDSTGIAHIIEHSVLCGSRKYPAKDPFVQLLKGSLQTFLNAMTYPDKTVYPVASQNLADFYNLVDVYLDAVFYPRITPDVLAQEGWHYQYDEEGDQLSYSGVVYNEMKGNYSNPDYLVYENSQNIIFPDITYGNDSGGNPECIPELTFAEFERFHQNFYHPSNARLFFWGDDDPGERLKRAAEYLDDFEYRKVESDVPLQPKFQSPMICERHCAANEMKDDDNRITMTWLLPDVSEASRIMDFQVLEHLLIGTSAAPLRKALIESGLGDDLTGCGLETHTHQLYFSTGLKGVASEDAERVTGLIESTLQDICEQGFERDLIQSSINTLEFRLRENNTGRTPRGLAVMLRTLKTWLHDYDPFEILAFEDCLSTLKESIANNPRHFEDLIRTHLIDNNHLGVLKLIPDASYADEAAKIETESLRRKRTEMSDKKIAEIIAADQHLRKMQETPDSPEVMALIPSLSIHDMPLENQIIPSDLDHREGQYEIIHHDLFTNDILYLDLGFNADNIADEDLLYLPLLSDALIDMGTEDEDYVSLSKRIGLVTGGIDTAPLITGSRDDSCPGRFLQLNGKCLVDRTSDMLAIFKDMLLKLNLDDGERMLQIALETQAAAETELLPAGHSATAGRLAARLSRSGRLADKVSGIDQLLFLRRIIPKIRSDWPEVSRKLNELRSTIVNRSRMYCNVTIDAANWTRLKGEVERFCNELPNGNDNERRKIEDNSPGHEFLYAESQVQYVGKAVQIRDFGTPVKGHELVAVRYLRTAWLWDQIRVQGGAYGAVAGIGTYSGIFSMASYRDPQIDRTLEIYDKTGEHLAELDIEQADLERAIIGTIGDLDTYRLPDAKGRVALGRHLSGRSEQDLQKLRDEVLATTLDQIRAFGEAISSIRKDGTVVILGAEKSLRQSRFAGSKAEIVETHVL